MTTDTKLTARELDNAIRMLLQEVAWMQQDLERAADCTNIDLKQCTIDNLIAPGVRRMGMQVEFVKRNS